MQPANNFWNSRLFRGNVGTAPDFPRATQDPALLVQLLLIGDEHLVEDLVETLLLDRNLTNRTAMGPLKCGWLRHGRSSCESHVRGDCENCSYL